MWRTPHGYPETCPGVLSLWKMVWVLWVINVTLYFYSSRNVIWLTEELKPTVPQSLVGEKGISDSSDTIKSWEVKRFGCFFTKWKLSRKPLRPLHRSIPLLLCRRCAWPWALIKCWIQSSVSWWEILRWGKHLSWYVSPLRLFQMTTDPPYMKILEWMSSWMAYRLA